MSTISDRLSRLAYMPPGAAADRLRAEVSDELNREQHAYYRQLAAEGRAGAKLMSLHYEAEQKKFLEAQKGR